VRFVGAVVAVALIAAGCGGRSEPPPSSLGAACGSFADRLKAEPIWLHTSDKVRLAAAAVDAGDTTVVLAHESPGDFCGWVPTMQWLKAHGIGSLAFDFRTFGESDSPPLAISTHARPDLQAAIDAARKRGANRVIVMGASFGGAAMLYYAPDLKDVDGLVNLSGELHLSGWNFNGIGSAPHIQTPILIVASAQDYLFNAVDAHTLYRRVASSDKQLVVFPGALHGWDLLDRNPRARARVLAWLNR
jgi:alpha-beta hydrolase superfamily lysophospholipase